MTFATFFGDHSWLFEIMALFEDWIIFMVEVSNTHQGREVTILKAEIDHFQNITVLFNDWVELLSSWSLFINRGETFSRCW